MRNPAMTSAATATIGTTMAIRALFEIRPDEVFVAASRVWKDIFIEPVFRVVYIETSGVCMRGNAIGSGKVRYTSTFV